MPDVREYSLSMKPLEDARHELYCQGIVRGLSGGRAAEEAGYELTSAHVQSSRLLKNDKVKARIAELQGAVAARVVSDKVMTVQAQEERLTEIASEDIVSRDKYPIRDGNLRALEQLAKRQGLYAPDKLLALGDIVVTVKHQDERTERDVQGQRTSEGEAAGESKALQG